MKTKILSLLLVLVLVIGITALTAMAEETTAPAAHEHCICGDWCDGRGDHDCDSLEKITWTPFSLDLCEVLSDGRLAIPAGNYYLAENLSTDKAFVIMPNTEVSICLNGKTLESSARVFRVHGILNIAECTNGTGKVVGNNGGQAPVFYVGAQGHINHYRGILRAKEDSKNYGGVGAVANDILEIGGITERASGSYTMYGGTIDATKVTLTKDKDGKNGSGGAVIIFGNADAPCSFTMYGGTIRGAKSVATNGAAINVPATATVKFMGGNIESGKASGYGDGIYVTKGADCTVGGKATIEDLYIPADGIINVENLTGSVGITRQHNTYSVFANCDTADSAAKLTSNVDGRSLAVTEAEGNFQVALSNVHADHCVCGGNLTGAAAENHVCAETAPTWTALTSENIARDAGITVASDRETDSAYNMFAQSGHYYLTENIQLAKNFEIRPGQDITICLNGYTLSTGHKQSIFRVTGGKLSICDCTGKGTVKSTWTGAASVVFLLNGYADATEGCTFNLYGGNLVATGKSTTNSAGVVQISNNNAATPAIMNMYGGTITGTSRKTGGAINMVNSNTATLNMYGGTITGGSADTSGGNISCSSGIVNIYGGTVSGGTAGTYGGNIYTANVKFDDGRVSVLNVYGGDIINGSAATRGGNIYVNQGTATIYGGNITGGTLTTHERGLDIGLAANANTTLTLDGKVNIGEIGVHGNANDNFALHLTKNFSTEKVINIQSGNLDEVIVGATKATLASFAPTNENAQLVYEGGAIYMRDAAIHYACVCGGTYEADGNTISHTCKLETSWVAVNAEFLANSATTTEEVTTTDETTGETTTETVTTVTGWGTPVNYEHTSLGGTFYEIPTGYYYLTEDLVLEHGLRVVKGADVKIDLNGHTITAPSDNARALFLQGSLRICDSSYDATKENKADQFKGGIIAARVANYSLAYVSADGELRIYGGNYYSNADCSKNTQGLIGATGKVYFFDGYYVASDMNGNGALVVLQISGSKSGYLAVRKGTLVGAAAKNGGIVSAEKDGTSLKIYSGDLIGSTVTNFGGAIYMTKGDLEVRGGTITGGRAVRGGNIYMGAEATIKVVKGTISNGTAIGAASGSNGGGGNIYTAGAIEISGGTITGGSATRTQSSAQAYGGNVYQNDTTASLLFKISGGTIENGSAVTGGNVFVRGVFEMTNGTITGGNAVEATAGNLRLEGKNGNTASITGGTISNGTSVEQGGNIFVRNYTGAVVISNATITGGNTTNGHGGSVYVTGLTSSLTMENTTITGGTTVDRAGNLYIMGGSEELAVVTLTNCTITDGTAGTRGGNIYVADVDATLNNCTVTGGRIVLSGKEEDPLNCYGYNLATNVGNYVSKMTINGGTYKDAGENNVSATSVHLLSNDIDYVLTVSGLLEIDDLRLGTDRMLTVGELTEGANIGISRFEIAGLFAPGAAQYAQYFHGANEGLSVAAQGEDLVLVSENAYWAFTAEHKSIGGAATIAEALKLENAAMIKLIKDYETTEVVEGDLYMDLNGFNLSGLTVNGNLYVVDYQTNNYEEDVWGSFKGTVTGSINGDKDVYDTTDAAGFNSTNKYVKIVHEDGSMSFHAISAELTYITLDPANDALGFKAQILGDSLAKAAVEEFGLALNVNSNAPVNYLKPAKADGTYTLRLKNIMKNDGGEMTIYGAPVLVIGDTTITFASSNTTMKKTIQAVNDLETLTDAQKSAVYELYAQYESVMSAWLTTNNIATWAPGSEEIPAA